MASIQQTIAWLNQLPEDIKETGKSMVRSSILSHGNYRTGRMYDSVQGSASGEHVSIRVWCYYASYVNDGRGPVFPKHRTKRGNRGWLQWADGTYHLASGPYRGSHFFDEAYSSLLAYIQSL